MTSGRTRAEPGIPAGRDVEVRRLVDAIDRVRLDHRGAAVLVSGEAGIGKTTLLHTLARAALPRQVSVIEAGASPLDSLRPFGLFIDAFALDGAERMRDLPSGVEDQWLELARHFGRPRLRRRTSPLEAVPEERARIIEDIATLVDLWTSTTPLLLMADDVHWVDPATLATLARLQRIAATQPLMLVMTHRPVPASDELRAVIALMRRDGAVDVRLSPMNEAEIFELVEHTAGAPPGPALIDAVGRAGGNPFLVVELIRSLQRDDRILAADGVADLVGGRAPRGDGAALRDVIVQRMTDLGGDAVTVIRVGAALGTMFSATHLAAALDRPVAALLPVLDIALDSGVLTDEGTEYRFQHELVREAMLSTISPSTLSALHLDIARVLAALGAPSPRVAAHYVLGAQPGDHHAIDFLCAAADEIVTRSPGSAVTLLDRALELLPLTDGRRDEIVARAVDAAFWSGDVQRAADLAEQVLARPIAPETEARLHETVARALLVLGRPAEAVGHAEALVATRPDSPWPLALAATFRVFALEIDAAASGAQHALDLLGDEDDAWSETLALSVLAWIENLRGFHERAVELSDRAVQAADRSPDADAHRLVPHLFRGLYLESAGRSDEAKATIDYGRELAERLGTAWAAPFYHYATALGHWNAGRWDDLLAECEAGLTYGREHGVGLAASWACAMSAAARLYRGERAQGHALVEEGEALLRSGGTQFGVHMLVVARALLLEANGDVAEAIELLVAAWDVAEGLRADTALVFVGPELVRLGVITDQLDRARAAAAALELSEPTAGRHNVDGHALRCRGLVDADVDALVDARKIHEECDRPVEVVLDREALAIALLVAGRLDEAETAVREALDAAAALDMQLVIDRLARVAARHGLDRGRRRSAPRQVTGWDALTDTEQRVARLVALGHSNPQCAAELLISRRTVESHLYRIYFKLGVANRTELAGLVLRLEV